MWRQDRNHDEASRDPPAHDVLIYTLRSVGGVGDMGRLAGIPGPGPADEMGVFDGDGMNAHWQFSSVLVGGRTCEAG